MIWLEPEQRRLSLEHKNNIPVYNLRLFFFFQEAEIEGEPNGSDSGSFST